MPAWDGIVPDADRLIYERAGFGKEASWTGKPALLIVDALWSFIGTKKTDVLGAIEEYPTACGEVGWAALPKIRQALDLFRQRALPVVYVCASGESAALFGATTRTRRAPVAGSDDFAYAIPDAIAPLPEEAVIKKSKASAFFRTPLDVHLRRNEVQTVLVAGSTTSGCIRASAVDAYSLGFETILLEDGVWDRSPFSHAVSLFELSRKYASVVSTAEACSALDGRFPKDRPPRDVTSEEAK